MNKYILAMDCDRLGWDDQHGDEFYVETNYMDMKSEQQTLSYLQKNIRYEGGKKTNFKTITEYCDEFGGIRFYERKF